MKQQSTEYQRIEQVKNFLNFQMDTEFSRFLGLKNSQIFSEIKRGKSKISPNLATLICTKCPQVNYEWLLIGNGEMLRPTTNDHGIVNSGNIGGNAMVQNTNEAPTLSVLLERITENLEKQQTERERLLSIIENQQQQLTQLINIQIKQQ